MSTIVNLSPEELADLKAFTNATDDATAVRRGMDEFIRFVRRMQLKDATGKVQMEDNWRALEATEIEDRYGQRDARPH